MAYEGKITRQNNRIRSKVFMESDKTTQNPETKVGMGGEHGDVGK